MRNPKSEKYQNQQARAKPSQAINSMATPRRAQSRQKPGVLGFVFTFGLIGGFVWLMMLIFGWGPYANENQNQLPQVQTPISVVSLASQVPSATLGAPTIVPTSVVKETEAEQANTPQANTPTKAPTHVLMPFILSGEPEAMSSALIRPSLGCDYLVIAGQVWDLQDAPVSKMKLHLTGELGGYEIDQFSLVGSATDYGKSGYEFALRGLVIESKDSLFIQLVDTENNPYSDRYALETFEDCQRNLIMVNFKQVR